MATSKINSNQTIALHRPGNIISNVELTVEYLTVTLTSSGAYNTGIPAGRFLMAIPDADDMYALVRTDFTLEKAVVVIRRVSDDSIVTGQVALRILYLKET